jgi:membrane-associated phospholipid phosphatase
VFALAAVPIGVTVLLAVAPPSSVLQVVRDWVPALWLIAGYWIPRDLIVRRHERLERWLLDVDRWWFATRAGRAVQRAPRSVHTVLELAYVVVYPMVPAALGTLLAAGARPQVDVFWSVVLTAEFACYACLPFAATRPPREAEAVRQDAATPGVVRRLNAWVLAHASNQWNTFPSGHVAGATAIAIAMSSIAPAAAAPFVVLAAGIALGSVSGRYHYLADALAGALVAAAAAALWL